MYYLLLKTITNPEAISDIYQKDNFWFIGFSSKIRLKEGNSVEELASKAAAPAKKICELIINNNIQLLEPKILNKVGHYKNEFKSIADIEKNEYSKFIMDVVPLLFDVDQINQDASLRYKKITPRALYSGLKYLIDENVVYPYVYFKAGMEPVFVLLRPVAHEENNVSHYREACLNYSLEAYDKYIEQFKNSEFQTSIDIDSYSRVSDVLFVDDAYKPDLFNVERSQIVADFEAKLEKKMLSFFSFDQYQNEQHPPFDFSVVKRDFIAYLVEQHKDYVSNYGPQCYLMNNALASQNIPVAVSDYKDLILNYRVQVAALERYAFDLIERRIPDDKLFSDEVKSLEDNIGIHKLVFAEDSVFKEQSVYCGSSLIDIINQAMAIDFLNIRKDSKLLLGLNNIKSLLDRVKELELVMNDAIEKHQKQVLQQKQKASQPEANEEISFFPVVKKESLIGRFYDVAVGVAAAVVGVLVSVLVANFAEFFLPYAVGFSVVMTLFLPIIVSLLKRNDSLGRYSANPELKKEIKYSDKNTQSVKKTDMSRRSSQANSSNQNVRVTKEQISVKDALYGKAVDAEPNVFVPEEMIPDVKKKMIARLQLLPIFKDKNKSEILNYINSVTKIIDIPYHTNGYFTLPAKFKGKGEMKLFFVGTKLDYKARQEIIDAYQEYFKDRIPTDMKQFLEAHLKKLIEFRGG